MSPSIKPTVHNIATPPQEDRATNIGNMREKFGDDRTCSSRDMLADRQTDRQSDNTPSAALSGRSKNVIEIDTPAAAGIANRFKLFRLFVFLEQFDCAPFPYGYCC